MNQITVVLSSYNGEKVIERQLDSIFRQKDVDVLVYVRDDGSIDHTIEVLEEYKAKKQPNKLIVCKGDNIGWQRSFLVALKDAPQADFYAFSDQDDIWFEDKLINAVRRIEKEKKEIPILFHCNKISTDESLKPLKKQVKRLPCALNRKNALVQEYAQGCSIVMNGFARLLVTRSIPRKIPHDFWCSLICYLFGKVLYDENSYFFHITYGQNASGEGFLWKSRFMRVKNFFEKKPLYNIPAEELLEKYSDMLTLEDERFLLKIKNYRSSLSDKLSLIFSPQFRRKSILATIFFKLSIVFNKL